jgi:hypothetical protein
MAFGRNTAAVISAAKKMPSVDRDIPLFDVVRFA